MIIGIPKYKDDESFELMMTSLKKSTNAYDEIIIIESFDNKKDVTPIKIGKMTIIKTPKEGPLKAYERLFKIAKERKEDLFLTQTDVLFPKCYNRDWLAQMKQISEIEECGIVTCLGGGGQSGPDFISGYNWVGAWCTYIPYRTIEKIGGYDMNIPLGYGVDIDYTYAVEQARLKVYLSNYWVDHHPEYDNAHEHERVDNFNKLKEKAFVYMRKKWKVGEFAK